MLKTKFPILLVEDNPVDLDLTLRAFKVRKLANPILIARDGEEALELCQGWESGETPPCLILLDINLPKVSGIDVLQRIKSHPMLKIIPVVILTTSERDKDLKKCYEMGANSYIVKPVDFDKFMEVVKQIDSYWLIVNRSFLYEDRC